MHSDDAHSWTSPNKTQSDGVVHIPPEVWYRVASFVPDDKLCDLISFNSVFLELAMDLRWKDVTIDTRYTTTAICILSRISDPYVAKRLKHLQLYLDYVKESTGGSRKTAKCLKYMRQQLHLATIRIFKPRRDRHEETLSYDEDLPESPRPTLSDVVDAVIDTSPWLANVTELTVEFWDLKFEIRDLPPSYGNYTSLFKSLWASFGGNLKFLGLGGNCLEGYREFFESEPCLKHLEELCLTFFMSYRVDHAADNTILVDSVAPFINSINPHIKVLEICSWGDLDISPLFKRLGVFLVLEHLKVRMGVEHAFASANLKQFLCQNSETLKKLDLLLNRKEYRWDQDPPDLRQWFNNCIQDERCFSHLSYLDVCPLDMPSGTESLAKIIQRASATLVHLTIRRQSLEPFEVSQILDAASSCPTLTHLRMKIQVLTIDLLDLCATRIPWLENLWLTVEMRVPEHIYQADQQRKILNWKLKDLSVWLVWPGYRRHEADGETLEALMKYIPSVTNFFGRERTRLILSHSNL